MLRELKEALGECSNWIGLKNKKQNNNKKKNHNTTHTQKNPNHTPNLFCCHTKKHIEGEKKKYVFTNQKHQFKVI